MDSPVIIAGAGVTVGEVTARARALGYWYDPSRARQCWRLDGSRKHVDRAVVAGFLGLGVQTVKVAEDELELEDEMDARAEGTRFENSRKWKRVLEAIENLSRELTEAMPRRKEGLDALMKETET